MRTGLGREHTRDRPANAAGQCERQPRANEAANKDANEARQQRRDQSVIAGKYVAALTDEKADRSVHRRANGNDKPEG